MHHIFIRLLAFWRALKAELRLQAELCKRYPFGNDTIEEINSNAAWYRNCHSYTAYLNGFKQHIDNDQYSAFDMPHAPYHKYTGAYGTFGECITNICCEHGTAYVKARNPSEAKDFIYESEQHRLPSGRKDHFYDDWLLTELLREVIEYRTDDNWNQPTRYEKVFESPALAWRNFVLN